MDEKALEALLREAENLPDDEARQRWLDALPPEVREAVLAKALAYAEAAFEAASDHLWAAQHVFEPLSQGETPEKPLPVVKLPAKSAHEQEVAEESEESPAQSDEENIDARHGF